MTPRRKTGKERLDKRKKEEVGYDTKKKDRKRKAG